mmetsp:Transcript_22309/g.72200  ORF Transcript_22309/g.72200 Transcript_22309/m.72200 type:complete len:393 (+) Transcript_22309:455-1633(+)
MAPGCEPNPVWFEWVHAKIVHLKIGIGKNGVEVETFDLVQVLLPGQGPHHRAHKLEVFCQHVAGRACEAAVPCEEALGHDDELRWRDFEGRLRKHGPLIDKVLLGPRLRLPLQLEFCQHAALILHSHGCGSGDGAAAAAAAATCAARASVGIGSGAATAAAARRWRAVLRLQGAPRNLLLRSPKLQLGLLPLAAPRPPLEPSALQARDSTRTSRPRLARICRHPRRGRFWRWARPLQGSTAESSPRARRRRRLRRRRRRRGGGRWRRGRRIAGAEARARDPTVQWLQSSAPLCRRGVVCIPKTSLRADRGGQSSGRPRSARRLKRDRLQGITWLANSAAPPCERGRRRGGSVVLGALARLPARLLMAGTMKSRGACMLESVERRGSIGAASP